MMSCHRDSIIAAGLTLASALAVAAIMVVGSSAVTESIGLVMLPGTLVIGAQWMHLRGQSTLAKAVLIGGPLVVLFLIGLLAGLAVSD